MIELKNVSFSYGEEQVLRDFSLSVEGGSCVCLFGPSGCGKTTVLRLMMGLGQPDEGSVSAPKRLSCVFQEDRLLSHLNVLDNVTLPLAKERYAFAEEVLEKVGLGEYKRARIASLSGGMRRRVALARAIAFGGDALLLDEPFNGVDIENKKLLAQLIQSEFTAKGKPVVLVSHILQDAQLLNAEIIKME